MQNFMWGSGVKNSKNGARAEPRREITPDWELRGRKRERIFIQGFTVICTNNMW